MVRQFQRLSARKIAAILRAGGTHKKRVSDGHRLYVRGTDWFFMYERKSKQTEISLGSLFTVSLAEARERALRAILWREQNRPQIPSARACEAA